MLTELQKEIRDEIIDELSNYEGNYLCDIPNYMYNEMYYIIGTYKAKEFVKENIDDVLEAIEYWKDHSGMDYPNNITNYEKLATFTVLEIAERLLYNCETFNDNNNETLDDELTEKIIQELKELENFDW